MSDIRRVFSVNGQPFFPVGAQAHNQSGQSAAQGEFVVDHRRNGDEISRGFWVEPDLGVLRVLLCE